MSCHFENESERERGRYRSASSRVLGDDDKEKALRYLSIRISTINSLGYLFSSFFLLSFNSMKLLFKIARRKRIETRNGENREREKKKSSSKIHLPREEYLFAGSRGLLSSHQVDDYSSSSLVCNGRALSLPNQASDVSIRREDEQQLNSNEKEREREY